MDEFISIFFNVSSPDIKKITYLIILDIFLYYIVA